jgi:hypothetical protein
MKHCTYFWARKLKIRMAGLTLQRYDGMS